MPRGDVQRDLVERAQRGDHDAFAVLAGATIARLYAAARLIIRDPDRAEDAVQETLVRCWRDLPTLRDVDRFDAWLHRLFLNACYAELRAAKRQSIEVEIPEIHTFAVSDAQSATADRDQIERGIRHLDPEHRTVIVLHHYLGLPLPDAAAAMGIPLGTAKSRLHRATQALRAALDSDARARSDLQEGRYA
jgi:RNA polymerase sigma factor (sigma-70 family)